jgi:hypothetical protein
MEARIQQLGKKKISRKQALGECRGLTQTAVWARFAECVRRIYEFIKRENEGAEE